MRSKELIDAIQTHECLRVLSFRENDLDKWSVKYVNVFIKKKISKDTCNII